MIVAYVSSLIMRIFHIKYCPHVMLLHTCNNTLFIKCDVIFENPAFLGANSAFKDPGLPYIHRFLYLMRITYLVMTNFQYGPRCKHPHSIIAFDVIQLQKRFSDKDMRKLCLLKIQFDKFCTAHCDSHDCFLDIH